MTKQEVCEKYNIPIEILDKYEIIRFAGKTDVTYNDSDLERLSLIMTLCDTGFSEAEVKRYMKLYTDGKSKRNECISMLENKRNSTLDEIHFKERQIENLDCLKYKIRNGGN